MAKVLYTKPALEYTAQLHQLESRGLIISDQEKAIHLLERISYYRLSGYWYPMLAEPKSDHIFKEGSTFENAFKLYCFDRELRKLIAGELEKIEIAVKAKIIYIMSHQYGPFWYNDPNLFSNRAKFQKTNDKLTSEYSRSDEEFLKAFKNKYSDPMPPSWMILEVSSFGNLSSLYSNLKPGRHKRNIANFFHLNERTFQSWLHSFTYVRNVCAHHARLWNKRMSITPQIPNNPELPFLNILTLPDPENGNLTNPKNKSVYFLLSMILYLLNEINPKHTLKLRMNKLLEDYPMIDVSAMGFPQHWQNEPLWE